VPIITIGIRWLPAPGHSQRRRGADQHVHFAATSCAPAVQVGQVVVGRAYFVGNVAAIDITSRASSENAEVFRRHGTAETRMMRAIRSLRA
jgi:hypothetical protein